MIAESTSIEDTGVLQPTEVAPQEPTDAIGPTKLDVNPYRLERTDNKHITPRWISEKANGELGMIRQRRLSDRPSPDENQPAWQRYFKTIHLLELLVENPEKLDWYGRSRYATKDTIPDPVNVPGLNLAPIPYSPQVVTTLDERLKSLAERMANSGYRVEDLRRTWIVKFVDFPNDFDEDGFAKFCIAEDIDADQVSRDCQAYIRRKEIQSVGDQADAKQKQVDAINDQIASLHDEASPSRKALSKAKLDPNVESTPDQIRGFRLAEAEYQVWLDQVDRLERKRDDLAEKSNRLRHRYEKGKRIGCANTPSAFPADFLLAAKRDNPQR